MRFFQNVGGAAAGKLLHEFIPDDILTNVPSLVNSATAPPRKLGLR